MIIARNLTRNFGKKEVLTGVDVELGAGGIHGLLGRNGVGKSTLLSILAGQLKPSGGTVTVFGEDPFDNASVMDRVCLAGVDTPYPQSWTGTMLLSAAALRYPRWDADGADELVRDFALDGALSTEFRDMSRGQRAMVSIVVALASGAELTLLDEPYVGLDTHNRRVFYQHLLRMGESGRTFIMATHHIHESAKVLDSFLILGRDGRVARTENIADVADEYVAVTAPSLPDSVLALRRSPGLDRGLIPRADLPGIERATAETADLDDIIDAMLEVC